MQEDNIIWTIKELYEWAIKNNYENFTVYTYDEGGATNIYKEEIHIEEKKKQICL